MKKLISILLLASTVVLTGCSDEPDLIYNDPVDHYDDVPEPVYDTIVSDLGITQDELWYYDQFAMWEPASNYVDLYTEIDGDDYRAQVYMADDRQLTLVRIGDTGFVRLEMDGEVVDEFYCSAYDSSTLLQLGNENLAFTFNTQDMVLVNEDSYAYLFETIYDQEMGLLMPGMTVTVDKDTCGITNVVNYYSDVVTVAPLTEHSYYEEDFAYAEYATDIDSYVDSCVAQMLFYEGGY